MDPGQRSAHRPIMDRTAGFPNRISTSPNEPIALSPGKAAAFFGLLLCRAALQ